MILLNQKTLDDLTLALQNRQQVIDEATRIVFGHFPKWVLEILVINRDLWPVGLCKVRSEFNRIMSESAA